MPKTTLATLLFCALLGLAAFQIGRRLASRPGQHQVPEPVPVVAPAPAAQPTPAPVPTATSSAPVLDPAPLSVSN